MKKIFIIILCGLGFTPAIVYGVMTSTNYSIIFDTLGVTGGDISTSTSYTISDTVGENFAQTATSTSYTVKGGFQSADFGSIAFSLSTNSLNLGTLSVAAVNKSNVDALVSSNTGYTLSVLNVTGSMPAAVAGGTVATGTEAYGFSVSGASASFTGDLAVTNGVVMASTTNVAVNEITTITFKAAMSATSTPGSYSQTVDLVATAK